MSNRQANSIFTLTTDVPSPEALRGEARIRGLKNELQTVKNHYAQELQVRAAQGIAETPYNKRHNLRISTLFRH